MEENIPTIYVKIFNKENEFIREQSFNQKTIHIGKLSHSHIHLPDESVSRQHAVIEVLDSGEVRVTDLESTNGTLVNGERITSTSLIPGDEILVGMTKLVIEFEPIHKEGISLKETFYVEPIYKEKEEDTGKYAIEIILLWRDEPYIVKHFFQNENVTIGELKKDKIFLPEELLGEKSYSLIEYHNGQPLLNLENQNIYGDCLLDGNIYTVKELHRKAMLKERNYLPLSKNTKCRLKMENFTLLISVATLPPPIKTPFFSKFNFQDHIYTVFSALIHLIFLMLLALVPEEVLKASKDPFGKRMDAFKVIQMAELEEKISEELKKEEAEKKKIELKEEKKKELTAETGEKKIKKVEKKLLASKLTPEELRERHRKIAMETGITKVLAQQDDLLSQILGSGGIPGVQSGIKVIASRGVGGEGPLWTTLDAFGGSIAPGGGSGGFRGIGTTLGAKSDFLPEDLHAIAGLEKGEATKGVEDVKFRETEQKTVVFVGEAAVTGGELDKETVRRYIHTRINQIKWCYQMEVQKDPALSGQVVVVFIISSTGKVLSPTIKSTTLNNNSVEDCIISRIAKWHFPSPKGGGVVRVTYPFIFKVTK